MLIREYRTKTIDETKAVQKLVRGCKNLWKLEDEEVEHLLQFVRGE